MKKKLLTVLAFALMGQTAMADEVNSSVFQRLIDANLVDQIVFKIHRNIEITRTTDTELEDVVEEGVLVSRTRRVGHKMTIDKEASELKVVDYTEVLTGDNVEYMVYVATERSECTNKACAYGFRVKQNSSKLELIPTLNFEKMTVVSYFGFLNRTAFWKVTPLDPPANVRYPLHVVISKPAGRFLRRFNGNLDDCILCSMSSNTLRPHLTYSSESRREDINAEYMTEEESVEEMERRGEIIEEIDEFIY